MMKFHSPTNPNLTVGTPAGSAQFIDGTYETEDPDQIAELKAFFAVPVPVKPLRSEVEDAKVERPKAAEKPKASVKKPAAKKAPVKAVKK